MGILGRFVLTIIISFSFLLEPPTIAGEDDPDRELARQLLQRAAEVAEAIDGPEESDHPWHRASVLTMIGDTMARAGDREAARTILQRAAELAEGIPRTYGVWTRLTMSHLTAGDYEAARRSIEGGPDYRYKDYLRVVGAQLNADRQDAALETLELAERIFRASEDRSPNEWAWALIAVARLRVRAGDIEGGLRTLESVKFEGEYNQYYEIHALCDRAIPTIVHAGELETAKELIPRAIAANDQIEPASEAARSSALIASAQALTDQLDTALHTAAAIATPASQSKALEWIVAARLQREDIAGAARAAREFPEGMPSGAKALAEVADAYREAGQLDLALELLRDATESAAAIRSAEQSGATERVAESWAASGHPEEAIRMAESIRDPALQAEAFRHAATALHELERSGEALAALDRADESARSVEGNSHRSEVLRKLAAERTRCGDRPGAQRLLDEAVAVAETIAQPFQRVELLGRLVRAQIAAGALNEGRETALRAVEASGEVEWEHAKNQSFPRGAALLRIAHPQAAAGDPEGAQAWCEELEAPIDQALSLHGVALGLIDPDALNN